ncbi:tRNA lysidine(34) synthetase TilS [Blautia faecicola]|uniref:tRNA lysidine(34) synthetase TilS n=1 Tax=Blautia faecicola TaxID=2509240 RepID=UPI003FD72CDC
MTTKGGSGQTNRQMWKTEQKVKVYVERFHMIEPKDTIVLGISGGADSVCLLKILARWKEAWGISLRAVHVHHQLRGEEADADERFVRELCENEGIPCRVFHEDVQGMAQREKIGLEEAGRIARYRCFATVCEDVGGGKIALAHHQDDLAETMLHHLVRGTGMAGLCSLKPVSGNRIRPLLCLEKEEILVYLEAAGQPWRTDSSNLEDDYTRNRIRHHVLEELKTEVNPRAVRHMAQLSEELEETRAVLAQVAAEKRRQYVRKSEKGMLLAEELKKEPDLIGRQIVYDLLKEISGKQKDFTRIHVEAVQELWNRKVGARRDLPYGMQAIRTYDGIYLERKAEKCETRDSEKNAGIQINVQSEGTESFQIGELTLTVSRTARDFGEIPEKKYTKWFDYDRIKQTLVIRHRQPGDRICLFDGGGSKKLKDYLIDRKIPAQKRDQLWLLADGSDILWIIGDRISAAYKVTAESQRILQAEIKGGSTHE